MLKVVDLNGLRVSVAEPAMELHAPVLFLHGIFGGAWYLERWQRFFAERGYPAFALDLRGHHGSRPVRDIGRVSLDDYVADALEAARALGRPIVVGHSMGGLIAQKLAELDTAMALVLVNSAPPRGISLLSARLARHQVRYLRPLLRSGALAPDRAGADDLIFNRTPPADRAGLFARLVPDSGRVGRELSLGTIAVDARRVQCPVLVVAAAEDHFIVPRIGRALARKYDATHLEFPERGHFMVHDPGWEVPAGAVTEWLARTVRTAEHPALRHTLDGSVRLPDIPSA